MTQYGFTSFVDHAPGVVVSNEDLPVRFESVASRTGIESRNVALPEETVASIGTTVVQKFFEKMGISGQDCDGLILASYYAPTRQLKPEAEAIATAVGLTGPALAVNFACSGFPAAVELAKARFPQARKHILIVCVEMLSRQIDWKDMGTAILFGDRASATSLHPQGRHKILLAWGERIQDEDHLISMQTIEDAMDPWGKTYAKRCIVMKGKPLYRMAPKEMFELSTKSMERLGFATQDLSIVAQHQANGKFAYKLRNLLNHANLMHVEVVNEIRQAGNVAASSIPSALSRLESCLCDNKIVACPAVGAAPDFEPGRLSHGVVVFRSTNG